MRLLGVPVIHVVTENRDPGEIAANPFWKSIHDDPSKARKGILRHNLLGGPGVEIIPELLDPADTVVHGKKRYNAFQGTDLEFVLRQRGVASVILAGINTTTCVLCAGFEATNRDFRVIIAADAVDFAGDAANYGLSIAAIAAGGVWVSRAAFAKGLAMGAFGIGVLVFCAWRIGRRR